MTNKILLDTVIEEEMMGAIRGLEMWIKRHLKLDLLKAVNPKVQLH